PPAPALQVAGVAALLWIAWSLVTVDGLTGWYWRGGLATVAVAALVVIAATTGGPPGWLTRLVALRPLAGLGRISYGVYLWHWPVIVYVRPPRVDMPGPALAGLRVALTLALALASYHAVERPVRRGALPGRRAAFAA